MEVRYFAYGSNLNIFQMMKRVGKWSSTKRAYLPGYKLVLNVKSKRWGGFAANLQKTDNESDKVYGVVYFLRKEKLDVMTSYEGPNAKIEQMDVIEEDENVIHDVAIYWWDNDRPSNDPPEPYKQTILEGLKQHGFKEDVIKKIESCSTS